MPIGHSVGVDPLVQRLRGHLGVGIQIDQAITETFEGHCWLFHHFRRHQLDEILASQFYPVFEAK